MMIGYWQSLVLLLSTLLCFPAHGDVPNLPEVKAALIDYVENGTYHQAIADQLAPAYALLKQKPLDEQWAFVFDIDETLLSNISGMKALSFGGNSELFEAMDRSQTSVAIPAVRSLYHAARERRIAVFIITGRSIAVKPETMANLTKEGITHWDGLFLMDKAKQKSIVAHKASVRCALSQQGYRLMVNIGDQHSDLQGDCQAEVNIKLPNPFYRIPGN